MTVMLLTFALLILVILAMSIGVIFANKPIKGSCGGLGSLGLKEDCPICGGGDKAAEKLPESAESLFYDAGKKPL
ncbi:(Na+)-NQR maturation NqrM [Kistimonas asteriae]|uniref:(Na+)-NQR maturation NqrM n=1 Tax=Kistimonas asteriae TaxID=517724 RepID=UPI001BADB00F|nr:(Na+)-NQR maturation NqrM [Kistimonas asteriae]